MLDIRILKLIQRLRELTERKMVIWSQADKDGAFLASFSGNSVGILVRNSRGAPGNVEYVLQIMDQWGDTIEEIGDEDADDGTLYEDMKAIFEKARNAALGVDDALDAILRELDEIESNDDLL